MVKQHYTDINLDGYEQSNGKIIEVYQVLQALKDPAISEKQWNQISAIMILENQQLLKEPILEPSTPVNDPKYNVLWIIQAGLDQIKDKLSEISLREAKEIQLVKMLEQVESIWRSAAILLYSHIENQKMFLFEEITKILFLKLMMHYQLLIIFQHLDLKKELDLKQKENNHIFDVIQKALDEFLEKKRDKYYQTIKISRLFNHIEQTVLKTSQKFNLIPKKIENAMRMITAEGEIAVLKGYSAKGKVGDWLTTLRRQNEIFFKWCHEIIFNQILIRYIEKGLGI
ncbi:unnamed protein product [Paramecium sonneborni]|uniref:Dynein heavy chain linker domain-containing protein n=1 Tax=Paramecium sonneborni TaxID=65129 RepID=A0A8S1MVQ1_9CILI|nr:unnamed protein product [Paramecium sonneborni]